MNRHVLVILAAVLVLAMVTLCSAQTSVTVPVEVVDSTTHIAVQASVEFKGPQSQSVKTDRDGMASVSLLPGKYQETITAPGYETLSLDFVVHPDASDNRRGGAVLVPVKNPEELTAADAQIRPGYTVVAGYAVDDHNQPIAEVHIRLQGKNVEPTETTTNYKGFFVMSIPSPPGTQDPHGRPRKDFMPGTGTLTADKSGYKTEVHTNIPLMSDDNWGVLMKMKRGSGTAETDDAPAWLNGTSGTCIGEHACDDVDTTPSHLKSKPVDAAPLSPRSDAGSPKPEKAPPVSFVSIIPPNATITIGTNCPANACSPTSSTCPCSKFPDGCPICTQACSGTPYGPIPLETYVQQGLQNEWMGSWYPPLDALEAGAVAYRTFGYYRVQHPRSSSYDIRSDTCDQVYKEGTITNQSTKSAAINTAGLATSDDGVNAYNSQYAANTNNWHGCGDGYAGDNINWPCMKDPIATGSQGAGAGWGMSQYGSWWWAEGLSYQNQSVMAPGWQCILDHYYNDNGNATGAGGRGSYRYSFLYGPGGDGSIAFPVVSYGGSQTSIYTMKLDGSAPSLVTSGAISAGVSWSPDHTTLAFSMATGGTSNVFTMSTSGGMPTQITFGPPSVSYGWPNWSNSGNNLLVMLGGNGLNVDEYSINASLPGQPGQLTHDSPELYDDVPFWAPNGYDLAFGQDHFACDPENDYCSYLITSANGSQEYTLYSGPTNTNTGQPGWSPDGSTIVFYAPCGSGYPYYNGIYSIDAAGGDPTLLICTPEGYFWSPRYSQDGRYIISLFLPDVNYNFLLPYVMNKDGSGAAPVGSLQSYWGQIEQTLDVTRCMRLDILQPAS